MMHGREKPDSAIVAVKPTNKAVPTAAEPVEPRAFAATYDLIIRAGRVIDPSAGLDAIRDVAITGGKIAAVEPNIAGDAIETIDARGKIVAPGLIDIHTHAGRSKDGPTGWVDAGTGGADNMDAVAAVARGRAADRSLPCQHRAHRRHCARRRVARHQQRQRGLGARGHRAQS